MKKRFVALLLSMALCLSSVVTTGASDFSDGNIGTDENALTMSQYEDDTVLGDDIVETEIPDGQDTDVPAEEQEPNTTDVEVFDPDATPVPEEVTPTPEEEQPGDDIDVFTPDEEQKDEEQKDEEDPFGDGEDAAGVALVAKVDVLYSQWKNESGKWKLLKNDGTYYTGVQRINTLSAAGITAGHDGYYYFGEDGFMVEGKVTLQIGNDPAVKGTHYLTTADEAEPDKEISGAAALTPYNSTLGQMLMNKWRWDGSAWEYYSSSGRHMTITEFNDQSKKEGTFRGYIKINGEYYCLDANGKPRTGLITLKDGVAGNYYFEETKDANGIPGKMFHGGWKTLKDAKGTRWIYYTVDDSKQTIGKALERGIIATKLDASEDSSVKDGVSYLIDGKGYLIKSKRVKGANGYYYATNSKGEVQKNKLVKINGARYYHDKNGRSVSWKNQWHRCPGASNRYYYFGKTAGKVEEKKGWQAIKSGSGATYWYYFSSNGNHYINTWSNNNTYYFKENGALCGGLRKIGSNYYFFAKPTATAHNGQAYKNKWIQSGGKWYYAKSNGVLYRNTWAKINGNYYYFQDNCSRKTNSPAKRGNVGGYLDSNGVFCTGWVVINDAKNQVSYINPDGSGFVKNRSMVIGGLTYYFDKNGYRINDVSDRVRGPYRIEVDRINGVLTIYNAARTIPVKSVRTSVGNPITLTPTGEYTATKAGRWQMLMGPSWGQYATHVVRGIYIHSVACSSASSYALPAAEYNRLGYPASHGCIRVCVADALWIYYNCNGVKIRIFDGVSNTKESMKGPLGKPALVPLRGSGNFDPTDPAVR